MENEENQNLENDMLDDSSLDGIDEAQIISQ